MSFMFPYRSFLYVQFVNDVFFCLHQGGLVWSPYAAEDSMDALYPDLAQVS